MNNDYNDRTVDELQRLAREAAEDAEHAVQMASAAARRAASAAARLRSAQADRPDRHGAVAEGVGPLPEPAAFLDAVHGDLVAACRFWTTALGGDHLAVRILIRLGGAFLARCEDTNVDAFVNTALSYLAQSNICIEIAFRSAPDFMTDDIDQHLGDVARIVVNAADLDYRDAIARALVARRDAHLAELDL